MAASDATPVPVKNQAYRVTFPILDNDGDLVTAAAALDSEVSKDAGTFADCTNEATEIATSSGVYYLDLTATEMNADTVAIIVKTTTTDAKTTTIILYPQTDGQDLDVNVTHWNGNAVTFGTGGPDVNVNAISDSTTAAANLEASTLGIITGSTSGTPSTTATDTDLTGYADDELTGRVIVFTGGTANGQASTITDYANTSGVVTYETLITAPAASDTFVIV